MKRFLILTIIFICFNTADYAQKNNLNLKFSTDLYSLHLWRGNVNGNSISIQPYIEFQKNNFGIGTWAAYAINGSYSELDIYITYQIDNIKFSLFDYFIPISNNKQNPFFDFNQKTTKHAFDFILEYEPKTLPIKLLASNLFYGDDKHPLSGKNFYSTYLELSYRKRILNKETELVTAITPYKSYYANKLNIVMAGIKINDKIKINSEKLIPVKFFLMLNPITQNLYLNFGICF